MWSAPLPQRQKAELARVRRESDQHIMRSAASNEDSAVHVLDSREAIDRSLRLLKTSPVRT